MSRTEKFNTCFEAHKMKLNKKNLAKLLEHDSDFRKLFIDEISTKLYRKSMISSKSIQAMNLPKNRVTKYGKYLLVKNTNGTIEQLQNFGDTLNIDNGYSPELTRTTIRGALWKLSLIHI